MNIVVKILPVFSGMIFLIICGTGSICAAAEIMQKPTDWNYRDEVSTDGSPKKCRFSDHCDGTKDTPYHTGMDYNDPHGSKDVRATAVGKVVRIVQEGSDSHGLGNVVIIKHYCLSKEECPPAGMIYTLYAHLEKIDSSIAVGMWLQQGQKLGVIGGTSGGGVNKWPPHLHFEVKQAPVLHAAALKEECMRPRFVWHMFRYLDLAYGYSPQPDPTDCGYFDPEEFIDSVAVEDLSGNMTLPVDFTDGVDGEYGLKGFGYATIDPEEQEILALPDFVVEEVLLETPWGRETYTYGQPETMKMHAQFENIGDGECSGDIEVHFYLSKGYKEDAHSEWERVGTDYIHCDNLEHGETHSEEEGIELWRDISAPGIWNIVACVDHYRDDHNNGGDYPEEHESNNCSTEAVFEVTADGNVVNVLDIDFTAHSLQFLQEPYYAGDQARFRAAVVNIGSDVSTSGIRSNYSVECPGTGRVYLTDDGTDAADLTPNATNWEETKAPVTMPNAVGDCVAYFCADYQGTITETDETNNCATLPFTLHQRVFRWSSAGAIAGMVCTQITEAAEPKKYTWYDNFFCAQQNYGIRWNSAGPIAGMRCTQITEAAEPKKYTWNDNYLCVPTDSPLRFYWSSAGLVSGKRCTQWSEPADPYTWNDNFLCYD